MLRRALPTSAGSAAPSTLTDEAEAHLLRIAGGDARRALTALEAGAGAALARAASEITLATLETAVDRAAVRYDRDGDQHYDVIRRSSSRSAAPTSTRRCTTWPG